MQEVIVFQIDKLVCVYSGASYYGAGLNICRSNVIEIIHSYSGENKAYCYYRMSGITGEMVEYLRYDAERNPQNPWFHSTDGSGRDISLETISKAELIVSEILMRLWNWTGSL